MIKNSVEVSVVIPAYNCKVTLAQVISNLVAQAQETQGLELIIVDDGSTDGTKAWLQHLSPAPSVRINCLFQHHQGAAKARNNGIINAIGTILLFLDADVIPDEHFLQEHLRFHRLHPQDHIALRGQTIDALGSENRKWTRHGVAAFKTKIIDCHRLPWIEFLSGNISLKRKFVIANNLFFNEQLWVCEDVEFGFRAQQQGLVLHYNDRARGYHHHPMTVRDYLTKARMSGQSYAKWYHSDPKLREELEKLGVEHYYGFIGAGRPIFWKWKRYIKLLVVNTVTCPLFLFLGWLMVRRARGKLSFWFYRQVYELNFRNAFRCQMKQINLDLNHGKNFLSTVNTRQIAPCPDIPIRPGLSNANFA